MYRRFILMVICLALMIIAAAAYAEAGSASAVSTKLDVAYVSKYVWRGTVPNPDPCLQPSLTFTHTSGASLNVWGSADMTDVAGEQNHLTEIDYTLDYPTKLAGRAFNTGLIHYTFPNTKFNSTSEAYGVMCFGGKFAPSLSANYDFDEAHGCYLAVTTGFTCTTPWQKGPATNLNLSAKVGYAVGGYNEFYFGVDKSAFTDLLLSASMPLNTKGKMTFTPVVSYSKVLDSALRNSIKDPDNFYVGMTASMPL